MEYTLQDKLSFIKRDIVKYKSKNPATIVTEMMRKDYINIHGPEHHYLDGAASAAAMKNAGGKFSLDDCLNELENRAAKIPFSPKNKQCLGNKCPFYFKNKV